jgi:hypothetical protein
MNIFKTRAAMFLVDRRATGVSARFATIEIPQLWALNSAVECHLHTLTTPRTSMTYEAFSGMLSNDSRALRAVRNSKCSQIVPTFCVGKTLIADGLAASATRCRSS